MKENTIDTKYSNMGAIIDSPIEDVTEELETLSYANLVSFKKMLEMQYSEVEFTKNEVLAVAEREGATEIAEDLYKVLQKIEDISLVTEELKKQKEVKF